MLGVMEKSRLGLCLGLRSAPRVSSSVGPPTAGYSGVLARN